MRVNPDLSLKEKKRIYYENNKEAFISKAKEWKAANRDKTSLSNKKTWLKATYGLAWEEFESLYSEQDGLCAICTKPMNFMGSRETRMTNACVDHCHSTGKIRGLLCTSCNLGIGHFQDTTLFLEGAIRYLKAHQ